MDSRTELSLLDSLKGGAFEVSIITTFNAYLPFYEEVVLPKLRSAGSRNNIVLMDAGECGKALAHPDTSPRLAGRAYTLIPIRSPAGAFHPKIFLAAGRSKGALHVGSHNLTLSGFGKNIEVTGLISATAKEADGTALVKRAWRAIWAWVEREAAQLPSEVIAAVKAVQRLAPWLAEMQSATSTAELLIQATAGDSMWRQVLPELPKRPRAISVVGAFFDKQLAFLDAMKEAFPRVPLCVAIDPDTVALPCELGAAAAFAWRNGSGLSARGGYLHAKAVYFSADSAGDVLLVGSSNPSAPAWLGTARSRNDEAMLMLKGRAAREAAEQLGLHEIPQLPSIDKKILRAIVDRAPPLETRGHDRKRSPLVAALESGELVLPWVSFDQLPSCAQFFDHEGRCLAESADIRLAGTQLTMSVSGLRLNGVAQVRFLMPHSGAVTAFVHHSAEIADLCRTGTQQALRIALDRLSDDTCDIGQLVAIVEKAVFSDSALPNPEALTERAAAASRTAERETSRPPSLVVNLKDMKQPRGRKRLLDPGSDLAYLLDVLFRELRVTTAQTQEVDEHGRSEEEQIGQDDEEAPPRKTATDDPALAQFCQGKVRRLVKRTIAYVDLAAQSGEPRKWLDALAKLVAVLAILRELRVIEQLPRWRRIHEVLVQHDSLLDLLEEILPILFGRRRALLWHAEQALGRTAYEELARLKGLLLWLAWDCRVHLESRYSVMDDPKELAIKLWGKAALLEIAQYLPGDDLALQEAHSSVMRCTTPARRISATEWLDEVAAWCHRVESMLASSARDIVNFTGKPRLGDLAYVESTSDRRLRVVSQYAGDLVSLIDLSEESGAIKFKRESVALLTLS